MGKPAPAPPGIAETLVSISHGAPVQFPATSTFYPIATDIIPAGKITPGCTLVLSGKIGKHATFNAGQNYRTRFQNIVNGVLTGTAVVVHQQTFAATVGFASLFDQIDLSYDLRWGFHASNNNFDIPSGALADVNIRDRHLGTKTSLNANAFSSTLPFSSFSAAPIVETRLVDLSLPVQVTVELSAGSTADTFELVNFRIDRLRASAVPGNKFPANATGIWGHSLAQGTGATGASTAIAGLMRNGRKGRPVKNFGLGGQTISQIAARILAEPVFGKHCDMVLWALENDSNSTAAAWWATVSPYLAQIMAFRAPTAKTIIMSPITSTAWSQAYRDAAFTMTDTLIAAYGSNVLDLRPFCSEADKNYPAADHADAIHPDDSGYAAIYTLLDAKMTARSWATP